MFRGLGPSSFLAFCLAASGQAAPNPSIQVSQIIEDMLQLPSPAPQAGVPGKQIPEGPMQSPHFSVPAEDVPLACFIRERANQGMHKSFFREDE